MASLSSAATTVATRDSASAIAALGGSVDLRLQLPIDNSTEPEIEHGQRRANEKTPAAIVRFWRA